MTSAEKNQIVQEVLSYIQQNSVSIADLTAVDSLPQDGFVEVSGARKISSANLKSSILSSSVKSIVYDQANHLIKLEDESGNVIDTLDATPFLSDGSGVTEVDYSDNSVGNYYFLPSNLSPQPTDNPYPMTDFIPVEPGYTVIFSGDRGPNIPFIVGYDSAKQNPRVLLGDAELGSGTADENIRISNYNVIIPAGVYFIRCCARGENYPGGIANQMEVKVRNTTTAESATIQSDAIELARHIFVPEGKKIILFGASFAGPNNGWDKILQDMTGIEVINKAVGSTKINSYTVARLLNANQAQPHGSLFMVNDRDVFDDIGAVIIMYTHNNDVLLNEDAYETRTPAWYRSHYEIGQQGNAVSMQNGEEIDFPSAWDYVIKQLKEWSEEHSTVQDTITADGVTAYRNNDIVDNQIQILILSHWLPSRSIYNESSRKLAKRHGVAYCPLDTELGFNEDDMIHDTIQYDGNSGVPKEGDYNRSVIHSEFVNVSGTRPVGRTETISGIIWGWHPQTISSSIDYGYGKMESRDGSKKYVPWIQLAIAAAVRNCVESKTASNPVETGENNPEKDGDYSNYEITGNYFAAETHVVSPSGNYTMTGYIKVEMGDTIIFDGTNQPPLPNGEAIPYIMGYSDESGSDPVVVLNGNDAEVKQREVKIANENIHYIRCCARIKGYNGAKWGMSVIVERAESVALSDFFASGIGANSLVRKNTGSSAEGFNSVAVGYQVQAKHDYSFAEGRNTFALGICSHAEGDETSAMGQNAHAEGEQTAAYGDHSHSEGYQTVAGNNSDPSGIRASHAEGWMSEASGKVSHAEGNTTTASGRYSHSEGMKTTASGEIAHAEGNSTEASGSYSHSEGILTAASATGAHAEGNTTTASGAYSHSEGISTVASGKVSHAGGMSSEAEGEASFAHGRYLETKNKGEAAFGNFNASNKYTNEGDEPDTLFSIGNGTEEVHRNAFEVKSNGDIYIWLNGNRVKIQDLLSIPQSAPENYGSQETNVVFQQTEEEQNSYYEFVEEMIDYYYGEIGSDDEIIIDGISYTTVDIGTQTSQSGDNQDEVVYSVDEDNIDGDIYTLLTAIWNSNRIPLLVAHLGLHDIDISIPLRRNKNREFAGRGQVGEYALNVIISYDSAKRKISVGLADYYYGEIGGDDELEEEPEPENNNEPLEGE